MSDVSVVVIGPGTGLGEGVGAALAVPFLPLESSQLESACENLVAARRLVWVHPVPAGVASTGDDPDGLFTEAELLVRSARAGHQVASRSGASLVFIVLLPSRGLLAGRDGAACDMAAAAMESLMRVEIGPWSNGGHRLLAVVYGGIVGHIPGTGRSEEEIRGRTPMHELCTYRQLSDAIRYVGSERAAYLTGVSLHVDGGWNAYSWMYPARTI